MATFYEYALPILLLVFLIICFMAFLWVKQQRSSVQEPIVFKPTYSKPYKPETLSPTNEGFQTGTGYLGSTTGGARGTTNGGEVMSNLHGSLSGSEAASLYPSQFDLSLSLQLIYGKWEITPFDKYYDIYEENEAKASALLASKFNDIRPAPSIPPDFGSTLGAFDYDTTRIPWDNDNAAYKPADIVWGIVSEQASRSIFLKAYLSEIAGNAASFVPCSADQPANFCYHSPLFDVNVHDPVSARFVEVADTTAQALVGLPPGMLAIVDHNNFSKVFGDRKEAISAGLRSLNRRASHALGSVKTAITKLGSRLGLNVGARKITEKLVDLLARTRAATQAVIKATMDRAGIGQTVVGVTLSVGAATATIRATATAGADASAITAAGALASLATMVDIFFGVFSGVMMGVEAILTPIIDALMHTGGVCPPGYEAISTLVPEPVLTLLSALIPLAPFLQTMDPFICWTTTGGVSNGLAVLKTPPKVPPFMSDRTLSLVYHAAWQNPSNTTLPGPSDLTIMMDPLPAGYVWLERSDLAKTPNISFLSSWAISQASIALGSKSLSKIMTQPGSSTLPSNVAVKTCEPNTTPGPEGQNCIQKKMPAGSSVPILQPCPAGATDDGYNCWKAIVDKRCIGGEIKYTTTSTWNDITGYFLFQPTPVCCKDATSGGTQDTTTCTQPGYSYRSTNNTNIVLGYMERITCPNPDYTERKPTELLCYGSCPSGFIRLGALCKGTTETYSRQYMFGTSTIYKEQNINTETMRSLKDITIPYCDFSSEAMLDKMAHFYYNNSQRNPQINEDGTIQVQIITSFYGVIASSELSCDVVCAIDFVTYDPITGGKYSSYTGCTYEDDPVWSNCAFCFRRFYFIRTGNEPRGEFTVTGCTFADYTAPEAMVQSNNYAANLVPSLPKKFDLIYKENVSIVDQARFNAAWSSGAIMAQAGAGLLEAGLSVVFSLVGAKGGAKAVGAAVRNTTKKAVQEGAEIAVKSLKLGASSASSLSKSVTNALTKVTIGASDFVGFVKPVNQELRAITIAQTYGLSRRAATQFVETMGSVVKPIATVQERGGMVGGLVSGIGAGLFTSMYLNPLLQGTLAGALPPADLDAAATTYVIGTDMYNLSVATNNNWWTVNHGPIYELAKGYAPNTKFCALTIIPTAHCGHKYIIRNTVNKYHNEFQRAHIKQIREIEPRGVNGCYYKWDEVEYDPMTNIEGTVLIEKEIILAHVISDYATCTFTPTSFITNVDNPAYPVRSYPDPSTTTLSTPRIIFPTRTNVYTSDLFARYVRVRPPLTIQQGGSKDGLVNLSQIAVFDASGFNISVQMETKASSVAEGAGTPDVAVNGTTTQSESLSSVWQQVPSDTNPYWEVDLSGVKNIAELIYFGADFSDAAGRNIGVRIEFLYTNGPNDMPITTYTLPTNESCQQISMHSSSISAPLYPIGGPVIIPRPIKPGTALALNLGCANKCEDRVIIDSLTQQYNDMTSDSTAIVKVLRGITANSTTCEYEVEMIRTEVDGGSKAPAKNTITKEIVSMQVTPTVKKGFGNIIGRFIKFSPSGVDETVLEFSKIIVRNTKRGYFYSSGSASSGSVSSGSKAIGDYTKNEQYIASTGANIVSANMLFELQESWVEHCPTQPGENCMDFLFTPPPNYRGNYKSLEPESFPNVFRARGNDTTTFFVIDLEQEYEIYDIAFVGCSDRTPGGIMGIKVEIFLDQERPTNAGSNTVIPAAYDGTYPPTYTYYLPTNDVNQLIVVEPPSQCTFTLTETDVLAKPAYLQENSVALSAVDTSGGVFSFSSLVNSAQSAWKNFMGSSPTSTAPIYASLKQSDVIVNKIQDTIVNSKSILNSGKKCSDPAILNLIMGAYNAKGSPTDQEFFVIKHTMKRILKAGQSTPSTCDVLFEDVEEDYDDYIVDITDPENRITSIKAARFGFVRSANTSVPVIPDLNAITYDISANALGIMNESSVITPVYSGTTCAVDCANVTQIKVVADKLKSITEDTSMSISRSVYPQVQYIFQTSPLSCEYAMTKITSKTSKVTNITTSTPILDTYVKALFSFNTDGCTPVLSSVIEYDPQEVKYNSAFTVASIKGAKVNLPSIYDYHPSSSGSSGSRYTSRVTSILEEVRIQERVHTIQIDRRVS